MRWIDEVTALHSETVRERANYDPVVQETVRRLYMEGRAMITELALKGPEFNKFFQLFNIEIRKVDELFALVDRAGIMHSTRMEPFVIYLCGPPGQGKSFLSTVLPSILAQQPPGTPNMIYSRNPGVDHWDGYTGQYAVVS